MAQQVFTSMPGPDAEGAPSLASTASPIRALHGLTVQAAAKLGGAKDDGKVRKAAGASLLGSAVSGAVQQPSSSAPSSATGSAGPPAAASRPGRGEPEAAPQTSLEAALEAWAACQPDGYALSAESLPSVLPSVARRLPGGGDSPEAAEMLADLFEPGDGRGGSSVFQQLLKVRAGKVHFLDFWRAVSKATYLLTSLGSEGVAREEGLAMELETVRDSALRLFETQASGVESIFLPDLAVAVRSAAAMSSAPEFWGACERSVVMIAPHEQVTLEELSATMVAWLQDAIVWQFRLDAAASMLPRSSSSVDEESMDATLDISKRDRSKGLEVVLHIYDVSMEEGVKKLNQVLAHRYSPVKFGGVFHAGVEVNGLEWSYGMSCRETVPGVACCEPRGHPCHSYRQTVRLKRTKLTAEEIGELLSQLIEEWPGDDYHLLRRNCCHFADDMCRRLGVGGIPGWVHRLARVGANVDFVMRRAFNRKLIPDDSSSDDELE